MLRRVIPEPSPVSRSVFCLQAQGTPLCSAHTGSFFIWPPCLGPTVMGGSHRLVLLPAPFFHSQLTVCLPACLKTEKTHTRDSEYGTIFGHNVTGNRWREVFFLFSETLKGGRAGKLYEVFSEQTLMKFILLKIMQYVF